MQASLWPRVDRVHRPRLWRITVVLGLHGMLATPMFFYAAELALDSYGWEGIYTVIVLAAGPATLLGYVVGGTVERPDRAQAGALRRHRGRRRSGCCSCSRSSAAVRPRVLRDDRRRCRDRGRSAGVHLRAVPDRGAGHVAGLHLHGGRGRRIFGLVFVGVLDGVWTTPRQSIGVLTVATLAGLAALRGLPETAGSDVIAPVDGPGP